jgi:hypothetical protein
LPVIGAAMFKAAAWGSLAGFAFVLLDRLGYLARLWAFPGAEPLERLTALLHPYPLLFLLAAAGFGWMSRALAARSFVKVQKDAGLRHLDKAGTVRHNARPASLG